MTVIRITGAAHVLNEWEEIVEEGWTTTPRRKVPANAGRLARRRSPTSFRSGSASGQSIRAAVR